MRASLYVLAVCSLMATSSCDDDADSTDAGNHGMSAGTASAVGGTGGSSASNAATGAGTGGTATAGTGTGGMAQAGSAASPEAEVKLNFERPQAGKRFLYAANPERGTVAIIDSETLVVQTVEVGDRPTFLRILPGTDDAIVLNAGADEATVLRDPLKGATTARVDVVPGANTLALAPDGKHAVVYVDAASSSAGTESSGFLDATVIELDDSGDTARHVTVGFRPRRISFAANGSAAYAVTDDGVSVLDLVANRGGSVTVPLVSPDEDVDQASLEVSITPDGRFALARKPGKSVIRLVDLGSGEIKLLDLDDIALPEVSAADDDAGVPVPLEVELTDLDLAANGKFALAVLRNRSAVLRIPVPSAFDDRLEVTVYPIEHEVIGSATIAPDAAHALLYTLAMPLERITVLDLAADTPPFTVALRKAVESVVFAPDGDSALIVHKKLDGSPDEPGIDPDTKIDRSFGYSLLKVASGDFKLQVTPVAASAFTFVPDSGDLFILFRDDPRGIREVQKVEAKTLLAHAISLGSPPISLGTVAGSERVFVNQQHPDGRLSLIDWHSDEIHTLTGFELNSRIRD